MKWDRLDGAGQDGMKRKMSDETTEVKSLGIRRKEQDRRRRTERELHRRAKERQWPMRDETERYRTGGTERQPLNIEARLWYLVLPRNS